MKRADLLTTAVITACVCATALTAVTIKQLFFDPPIYEANAVPVRAWRKFAAVGDRIGPANARVTIVEFSDFQCPVCRSLHTQLSRLEHERRDIAIVYRHFPLEGHPYARDAARASECAASQGKFREYHDALFAQPLAIGVKSWVKFARDVNVPDTVAFAACLRSAVPDHIVDRDIEAGDALGVIGTPTLLINNLRYIGIPPDLGDIVDDVSRANPDIASDHQRAR